MNSKKKYPFGMRSVYLSSITVILSVILAVLLLHNSPMSLLLLIIFTSAITAIVFALRVRFLSIMFNKSTENSASQSEDTGGTWKVLVVLFGVLLALFISPLLLSRFLDPSIWVTLVISLSAGVSLAEVLFHLHIREESSQKHQARKD